jgi:hypothetical protein
MVDGSQCASAMVPEGRESGTVDTESNNRKFQVDRCGICREYAEGAMAAVAENKKLNCKLSGPRWSENAGAHFGWCMSLKTTEVITFLTDVWHRSPSMVKFDVLEPETHARNEELRLRKLKASKQGLKTGSGAATPYGAVPQQKEKAAAKPVQAARKPPDRSAETSRQKVPAGGGSSAMDRLGAGGGSPSGTGSAGAGSAARPRGSSAAAPGPSESGGGGGTAAPATSINRNAIGGGSERVR